MNRQKKNSMRKGEKGGFPVMFFFFSKFSFSGPRKLAKVRLKSVTH